MLYDLLKLDLANWHPREVIRTKALAEQQERSLSALDEWWLEVLQTGVLVGASTKDPGRPVSNRYEETTFEQDQFSGFSHRRTVRRDGLYDHARASSPRLRSASDAALGRYLREEQKCKRARVARRRGWQMPPLTTCRARWPARYPDTVWHLPDLAEWVAEGDD